MGENRALMRQARRHVERAAAHLADAASALRSAGFEQDARTLDNASYEAAVAISCAESRRPSPETSRS